MKIRIESAIVAAIAVMLVGGPAMSAAFDAQNADKVDGKHAVGAGVSTSRARGKLVATDANGKFAAKFIPKVAAAANADKLGGKTAAQFALAGHDHPIANVATVAESGADFTSIQDAIDSLPSGTPGLVWVAPGEYDENVTVGSQIHLKGSGPETMIHPTGCSNPDAVTMTGSSRLSDLSVIGPTCVETILNGVHMTGGRSVDDVSIFIDSLGGAIARGIWVDSDGPLSPHIRNVDMDIIDAYNSWGLVTEEGSPVVEGGRIYTERDAVLPEMSARAISQVGPGATWVHGAELIGSPAYAHVSNGGIVRITGSTLSGSGYTFDGAGSVDCDGNWDADNGDFVAANVCT